MAKNTLLDLLNNTSDSRSKKGLTIDKLMIKIGASATLFYYPNNIYVHLLRTKADKIDESEMKKQHYFGGKYYEIVKVEEFIKDFNPMVKLVFKEIED